MQGLLLLLVAGLCSALQPGMEYVYRYRMKVTAGIPGISPSRGAAADVIADLRVRVLVNRDILFKMENVEYVNFNGDLECDDISDRLADEYLTSHHDLGREFATVQKSTFHLFHEDDEQWTINFYKSIISNFVIEPFNVYSQHSFNESAYITTSDTVQGDCHLTYTQHLLLGIEAAQHEHFLEDDVEHDCQQPQRAANLVSKTSKRPRKTTGRKVPRGRKTVHSKTSPDPLTSASCPELVDDVYEVTRSTNLEDCIDIVEQQHTLNSVYCSLSGDQCKNIYSRNTHGTYVVRGSAQGARLEKAEISGTIAVSPFGYETEQLVSVSRQKLSLVSAKPLTRMPSMAALTQTSPLLMYKMTVPYLGISENHMLWGDLGTLSDTLKSLSGVTLTESDYETTSYQVAAIIEAASGLIKSRADMEIKKQVPVMLNYATSLLYEFTNDRLQEIFGRISHKHRGIFFNVLTEVGTTDAVEVLIMMLDGRLDSQGPLQQSHMYSSLNVNIKSAQPLRPLLNFLKKQNLDVSPFATSQSIINFASLLRRLCRAPRRGEQNSFYDFSYTQCQSDNIVEDFHEYIFAQLEGTEEFWKQLVLVKALVNVRTIEASNYLLPYILGAKDCDTMVRASALESLASWMAADTKEKEKITLILLDIFENSSEDRILRARALGYLSSWQLSSTTWTRLAYSTRRPGLRDLAALTYSLIKSTSEYEHPNMLRQRQFAVHALSQAKPSNAASRYSSFNAWFKYISEHQIGRINHIATFKDPGSPLPSELSIYMRRVFGGVLFYKKVFVSIANDDGDLTNIATSLFNSHQEDPLQPQRGRWLDYIRMLQSDLHIEEKLRDSVKGLININPSTGNEIIIPLAEPFLKDIVKIIMTSQRNGPLAMYSNPLDLTFVTINDIGMPVVTTVARPTLMYSEGSVDMKTPEHGIKSSGVKLFYGRTLRTHMAVMVPWSRDQIATGVSNTRSVSLPLDADLTVTMSDDAKRSVEGVSLTLSLSMYDNIPFLTGQNVPYTIAMSSTVRNLQAISDLTKPIFTSNNGLPKYQVGSMNPDDQHGIWFAYNGDLRYALVHESNVLAAIMKGPQVPIEMYLITPSAKFYETVYYATANVIGFSNFTLTVNVTKAHLDRSPNAGKLVSMYGQDKFEDYELCGQTGGDFTQQSTGQQTGDYDYSQAAQNPQEEFESFGSFGGPQQAQTPARLTETQAETVRPSQGFSDVSEPQLRSLLDYLRQNTGWQRRIDGYSVRFDVSYKTRRGTDSVSAEAVGASTICYNLQDRKEQKSVIAIGVKTEHIDISACYERTTISPKINDLDTIDLLTNHSQRLAVEERYDIYYGKNCAKKFASEDISYKMSDKVLTNLKLEMDKAEEKACDRKSSNALNIFHENALFDSIAHNYNETIRHRYHESVILVYLSKWYNNILTKYYNYNLPIDCPRDDEDQIDRRYSFNWIEDNIYQIGEWMSYEGTSPTAIPEWLRKLTYGVSRWSDYAPADYCVVDERSVQTFDELDVNITVEECPILLSKPCESGQLDDFAVAVKQRRDGTLAVHVAVAYKQIVVNIDDDGVKVNNEQMNPDLYVQEFHYEDPAGTEQISCTVYRRNGFYKVEVPDTLDILYKEKKIYLKVADRFRGMMCGLCGNMDLEPSNDLVCPKNCALVNPDNFAKAWTPATGFDCHVGYESPTDCHKVNERKSDFYTPYQF